MGEIQPEDFLAGSQFSDASRAILASGRIQILDNPASALVEEYQTSQPTRSSIQRFIDGARSRASGERSTAPVERVTLAELRKKFRLEAQQRGSTRMPPTVITPLDSSQILRGVRRSSVQAHSTHHAPENMGSRLVRPVLAFVVVGVLAATALEGANLVQHPPHFGESQTQTSQLGPPISPDR